jgi:hypothetical protein
VLAHKPYLALRSFLARSSDRYKHKLVAGAREQRLSPGYVSWLESLPCVEVGGSEDLDDAYYRTPSVAIANALVSAVGVMLAGTLLVFTRSP